MITIPTAEPSPSPTPIPTKDAFQTASRTILGYNEIVSSANSEELDTAVTLQNLLDYGASIAAILNAYSNET